MVCLIVFSIPDCAVINPVGTTIAALPSYESITEKNYSFSAGQYFEVKIEYIELSEEDFNRRMAAYAERLDKLFKEGEKLEESIKERLGELKYED